MHYVIASISVNRRMVGARSSNSHTCQLPRNLRIFTHFLQKYLSATQSLIVTHFAHLPLIIFHSKTLLPLIINSQPHMCHSYFAAATHIFVQLSPKNIKKWGCQIQHQEICENLDWISCWVKISLFYFSWNVGRSLNSPMLMNFENFI